jgi:hypothetical protein
MGVCTVLLHSCQKTCPRPLSAQTPLYDPCYPNHPASTHSNIPLVGTYAHPLYLCRHTVRPIRRLRGARALSTAEAVLCCQTGLRLCRYLGLLPVNHHLLRIVRQAAVACSRSSCLRCAVLRWTVVRTRHLARSWCPVSGSRSVARWCCCRVSLQRRDSAPLWGLGRAIHGCHVSRPLIVAILVLLRCVSVLGLCLRCLLVELRACGSTIAAGLRRALLIVLPCRARPGCLEVVARCRRVSLPRCRRV